MLNSHVVMLLVTAELFCGSSTGPLLDFIDEILSANWLNFISGYLTGYN